MENKISNFFKENIIIFLIFLSLVVLSSVFLYVGDDWVWATSIGMNRLKTFFENYNGRYFSDILIIIISRFNILRILLISSVTTGIVWLIKKITLKNNKCISLSFLFILATPVSIFINSVAWASGFVNYVVSIFFVLIFLYFIKDINEKFWEIKGILKNVILIFLGFLSSLIVEHVTIYLILLVIFLNIYSFIKYKKISKSLVLYGIGVICGAVLMFSNEAYISVINGDDVYRSSGVTGSFIDNVSNAYFKTIYRDFIFNNYLLNIIIGILLLITGFKKDNRSNKVIHLLTIGCLIYVLYTILKILNPSWNILGKYTIYLEGIATIFYCLFILIIVIIAKNFSFVQKERLIFILVSTVTIAGPMLVVTPVTPRCFFPTYVMLILFVIQLISSLNGFDIKYYFVFNRIVIALFIVFYLFWLSIFSYNYLNNVRRTNYIRNEIAKGETVIEIYKLPYEKYIGCDYGSYPSGTELWERIFKEFYAIDRDITITMGDKKEPN